MADVELVIKIPEEYYKAIKEIPVEQSSIDMLIIRYGTPLPKGHGRLIDADALENYIKDDADEWDDEWDKYALAYVGASPTIIEKG